MLNVATRFEEQVPGLLLMDGSNFRLFPTLDIAPVRLSPADGGTYRASVVASLIQKIATKRAGRDSYKRINASTEDKTYSISDRGLEFTVDPKDVRNVGGDESIAIQAAAQPALLSVIAELHTDLVNLLTGSGVQSYAVGTAWTSDSSDPVADVHDAINTKLVGSPVPPNVMVIGKERADRLTRHPKIKALFTGASTDLLAPAVVAKILAQVFGLEEVIIDQSRKNSADQGQAGSFGYIFPSTQCVLMRRERTPMPSVPQTVRTFVNTRSITNPFEAMALSGMELLGDTVECWTWPIGNPGGRAGVVAVLAEPTLINAETAVRITSI